MYISQPIDGVVYIAERPRYRSMGRVNGLAWSVVPVAPTSGFTRIDAARVPKAVRRQAYRHNYKHRGETR
jgi:hypothetical protein